MPTFMAYVILALAVQLLSLPLTMAGNFTLSSDSFLLNNKPHPLYSGSLHYSRVPPSLWSDRLDRLQALGLNTVQTYVPWNYHETDFEGTFDFTSPDKNLVKFLQVSRASARMCEGTHCPHLIVELLSSSLLHSFRSCSFARTGICLCCLGPGRTFVGSGTLEGFRRGCLLTRI